MARAFSDQMSGGSVKREQLQGAWLRPATAASASCSPAVSTVSPARSVVSQILEDLAFDRFRPYRSSEQLLLRAYVASAGSSILPTAIQVETTRQRIATSREPLEGLAAWRSRIA